MNKTIEQKFEELTSGLTRGFISDFGVIRFTQKKSWAFSYNLNSGVFAYSESYFLSAFRGIASRKEVQMILENKLKDRFKEMRFIVI